jgi:hypothetical protein
MIIKNNKVFLVQEKSVNYLFNVREIEKDSLGYQEEELMLVN